LALQEKSFSQFCGKKLGALSLPWKSVFDYGDEWHFIVELKRIETSKDDARYPLVVESVGEAPPQYGDMDEEDEF
jgi:hypothetical protein